MAQDDWFDIYDNMTLNNDEEYITDWINTLLKSRGIKVKTIPKCNDCKIELIISKNNIICPECGVTNDYTGDIDYLKKTLPYKRMTHFKDWLIKSQGKHNPLLSSDIIDKCSKLDEINYNTIKTLLRKEKLTKHYEDIWYIISCINPNFKLFKLTPDEENLLCNLFLKVQFAWEKFKPRNRKSIISYPFIITKLLEKINREDLIHYFILPKYNKIIEYETIWRKIELSLPN